MKKALWCFMALDLLVIGAVVAGQLTTWVPEDRRLWILVVEGTYWFAAYILAVQTWNKSHNPDIREAE